MAYPKSHNPFADDDEEEEYAPKSRGFGDDPNDIGMTDAERRQRYLQQEVMRTAQSAMDSSYRSLGLIYESEKMGVDAAEELIRQGEALKRTDRMLDNMEHDLKTSQKHINGIKSMWGGLVNYFRGKNETKPPPEQPSAYHASDKLQDALSNRREFNEKYQASHPNLRRLEAEGFGAAESTYDGSSKQNGYSQNKQLKAAHQTLDNNLDEMSEGLRRLKNLGLGLQTEIDSQDSSVKNLLNKVDKMDGKIQHTNQQIKNL
ncbi:synaptosomal-associated protein 29 [Thalassophryne amazonica]|uniref:synaptosomal-associated protein 29 n=1 Tax=Thalassophryne amazonica TaxID=390379 RepID=UPI001471EBB0|nr:synaptosomal-associated protein 29 [Thalassophryne amazonica]